MYIKEIKINGFKSFASSVNLELSKNFTGIVGPNGSGKSNIVDALKWVMGEQSVKTLRGQNGMTDVIFNGSSSREAARSAKVEIVLDNTDKSLPLDFSEIEIKRVVYRTGENEYFINKEKVRLKDITDLFIDSFSSKESLSIIPQGKISEILGGNSFEKRGIIEEAAGVVKYKKRKEETLRKLARTNENIERVNMLINELSLNIEPLKKEKEKALIYKENKEKLESIEVGVLASDISTYNDEYTLVKNEKEKLELIISEESTSDIKERTLIEELRVKRSKLDEEVSSMQKELLLSAEELNELNSKKELLKERTKYDKESSLVKQRLSYLEEEKLKISTNLSKLNLELEESTRVLNQNTNKLNDLNNDLNKEKANVSKLTGKINELTKKKYDLVNRRDILLYNIENMTKVPYSVKSVLNNPSLRGIRNTIGSIIEVESTYTQAIETLLGGSTNYVVTESDISAKEAIDYLKTNNKGRVTFFPLNLIKPKYIDETSLNEVKNIKGFIGVASDLVTYDKEYVGIIKNQLGNSIVVDNIDNALIISKKINSKYRIASLDGEIVHVGGSLTGGSLNKSNSNFTDKSEFDSINRNINSLINEISSCEESLKDTNNKLNDLVNMIYKTNLDVLSSTEKESNIKNSINLENESLNKITLELTSLGKDEGTNELDEILNEYYEKEKNKKLLEQAIINKETLRKEVIEELEFKEETLKKYNSKNKENTDRLNNLNIKEAKLSVIIDNLLNRLSEEYNLTYERARNNYELNLDINEAKTLIGEIKRTLKNLGEVNLSSIEEYERVSKRYEFLSTQKEDLVTSEQNLLKIINDMDDIMIEKFATTFKKVNNEFMKVFKELFGGGSAKLELTDPTNMLETGIEIIANPPGKKPGVLSLLSGGEKTLTAISLLFAVMNLKDVPFVILDEVESALDEVNVEKFGEYINHYKGKTQLLVITHKKKTMEYVDSLYGITMEESGVSKLVSVKLEEIKAH